MLSKDPPYIIDYVAWWTVNISLLGLCGTSLAIICIVMYSFLRLYVRAFMDFIQPQPDDIRFRQHIAPPGYYVHIPHARPLPRRKSPDRPLLEGVDRATDDETRACVICITNEKQCAAVPCGHLMYCISCATKRQETKCPMCRKKIKDVIRIYV